ncbi:MAG: hypothetical protein M3408_03190 [Actinomycetota bacterium]|nr:hypothetical protein [Actinomycetota bacterium]
MSTPSNPEPPLQEAPDRNLAMELVRVAGDLGAVAGSGAPDKRHLTSVARPSRTRSADGRIGA